MAKGNTYLPIQIGTRASSEAVNAKVEVLTSGLMGATMTGCGSTTRCMVWVSM